MKLLIRLKIMSNIRWSQLWKPVCLVHLAQTPSQTRLLRLCPVQRILFVTKLTLPSSSSILPRCPGLAVGGHEAERLLADLPRRVPEGAALLQPTGEEQDRQLHHCYHHYCTFDIVNDIVKNIIENSTSLQEAVTHDPSLTFWTYLLVRTLLGVLTAARFLIMIMSWSWSDHICWHQYHFHCLCTSKWLNSLFPIF